MFKAEGVKVYASRESYLKAKLDEAHERLDKANERIDLLEQMVADKDNRIAELEAFVTDGLNALIAAVQALEQQNDE